MKTLEQIISIIDKESQHIINTSVWYDNIIKKLQLTKNIYFSEYCGKKSGKGYIKAYQSLPCELINPVILEFNNLYSYIFINHIDNSHINLIEFKQIYKLLVDNYKTLPLDSKLNAKAFINYTYGRITSGNSELKSDIDIGKALYSHISNMYHDFEKMFDTIAYIDTDRIIFDDTIENIQEKLKNWNNLPPYQLIRYKKLIINKIKAIEYIS